MMARPVHPDHARDERKHHFFILYNPLIDAYLARIGASAFALYCTLVRIAGAGRKCFPGLTHLSNVTGMSRNTILKSIDTLVEAGLIRVEHRPDRKTNEYIILDLPGHE